jgi:ribosomal protein S18 acetylase RimI-like enzyme
MPVGHLDEATRRRLLTHLTSEQAGTILLADDKGLVLVATVVDVIANPHAAAVLVVLGARGLIADGPFAELVLEPAAAFARAGGRVALLLDRPAFVPAIDALLARSGFVFAYESCRMRRGRGARMGAAAIPLPDGWRFATMDDALVPPSHVALIEMFRGVESATLAPLEAFRRGALGGIPGWRVLLDGDNVAGLVRMSVEGGQGEVRILGRHPSYRGRGLGRLLLDHALRVLASFDVEAVHLEVEARNDRALDLYRGFDFEIAERTPCFRRSI